MKLIIQGPEKQAGVMLLEALIAILVFSVGILAIVGMQATAAQDQSEAKYRTQAAFLANRAIGQMWGFVGTDPNQIQAKLALFAYGGSGAPPAAIASWVSTVQSALPGTGAADFPPIITVNPDNSVVVTVRWRAARDKSNNAQPHTYRTIAYISL